MPKPTKRSVKTLPNATSATIPEPFTAAPAALAPFLSTFAKDTVYITHIDPHPYWFKRRVFFVPVLLNVAIAALLTWRFFAAYPFYWSLVLSFLGNYNDTTVILQNTSTWDMAKIVVTRGAIFLFDWLLFRIIGSWPWSFFVWDAESGTPAYWRLKVGFRDQEIYVRQSRGWGSKDLLGEAEGSTGKAGGDSPFFKTRILPAVDNRRLREKTGYLLMDSDWDLDFFGMVTAHKLLDDASITASLVKKSVFMYVGTLENGQWAVWNFAELDEDSETVARQKILLFKDKLTKMGKENLFFKWVELVQFESNAPGGFTEERQVETAKKAKEIFEEQGVDFDTFIREIDGLEGLPGMEQKG